MPSTSPKPGEIWKVDWGLADKVRWFIVVSRYDPDVPRALALGVPVTTKYRGSAYTRCRWESCPVFGRIPSPMRRA